MGAGSRYDLLMRAVGLALVAVCGCYEDTAVPCGTKLCTSTQLCVDDTVCATQAQLTACESLQEQSACTYEDAHGVCRGGVCSSFDCGDGARDPGEQCDDGNTISGDGCRADCLGRFDQMSSPVAWPQFAVFLAAPDVYSVGLASSLHYDGTAWTSLALPAGSSSTLALMSVWASSPTDVWLGGSDQSAGVLFHFDGTRMSKLQLTNPIVPYAIWGTSANDIYAVGGGGVRHYTAGTWTPITPCGSAESSTDVVGTAAEVYISSNLGICRGSRAKGWTPLDPTSSYKLAIAGDTLYSLTQSGIETFSLTSHQPTGTLVVPGSVSDIAALEGGALLAVGMNGVVLEYDPATQGWTRLTTPTASTLQAVVASSASNVFIVGDAGTILH
jgi:cysteine-rich repeat protein